MLMDLKDAEYFLTFPSHVALNDVLAFNSLVSPHYLNYPKGAICCFGCVVYSAGAGLPKCYYSYPIIH